MVPLFKKKFDNNIQGFEGWVIFQALQEFLQRIDFPQGYCLIIENKNNIRIYIKSTTFNFKIPKS